MGENTRIAWCDHTWNPWHGCQRVSAACTNCYAEAFAKRLGQDIWGKDAPRRFFGDKHWNEPLRWNAKAAAVDRPARVFCASMADVFEDRPDLLEPRARLWRLIADTPHLDWLLLTKRPQNIAAMRPDVLPPNVWLGTTVEDQRWADERIPHLAAHDAAVRFLSMEPLLGPVDLTGHLDRISWVILGGESGPKARGFPLEWTRDVMAQVAGRGPALFVKQLGTVWARANGYGSSHADDPAAWPEDLRVQEFPSVSRPPARLL